jgi:hypothetical protein
VVRDVATGLFRVVEDNGELVDCWLPGHEDPDQEGALDAGGFEEKRDGRGFCLAIDLIRAERGLIPETVADIEAERLALDTCPKVPG